MQSYEVEPPSTTDEDIRENPALSADEPPLGVWSYFGKGNLWSGRVTKSTAS
jgi:hypothetical protein